MKIRPGDQPLPVRNDATDVQTLVIRDIQHRRQVGIERYGTALQPHNGRDALRDLYEELIDAAMYVRQVMAERDQPIPSERLVELERELRHKDDVIEELRRQLDSLARQLERKQ